MGFSLTITEGKEAGRQFSFEQSEVSIGRTAENDVVLYDPGVSRKHVVIRSDKGHFYVQDMGSANGTQVNGSPVTEEELQHGDALSVGPVVFSFEVMEGASTRIVSSPDQKSLAKRPQSPDQLAETKRRTQALPARKASLVPPAPARKPAGGPPARAQAKPPPLSASERARLRREHTGLKGKLELFFMDKPPAVKYGVLGGGGVLLIVLVLIGVKAAMGGPTAFVDTSDQSKKHFQLGEKRTDDIYGLGEGVTIQTKDELHLDFDYQESIPMVYYLKFRAAGVEQKEEVDVSLNGVHIAYVTPSLGDYAKDQVVRLPKKHLKAGIPNEVVFDNTFNPPRSEAWAISRVRLVTKPIPRCDTPAECLREAKKLYDLADTRLQQKDIAASNRFEAWMALQKAMLFLEGVDPKPDLYSLTQQTLRETERDLDTQCKKIMMTAEKYNQLQQFDKSINTWKTGLLWFPSDDHPCRGQMVEKIEEFGGTLDTGGAPPPPAPESTSPL